MLDVLDVSSVRMEDYLLTLMNVVTRSSVDTYCHV